MKYKIFPVILASIFICSNLTSQNKSIDLLEQVSLGGVKQWVHIKSENIENPILLFLHGGPGFTEIPNAHYDSNELIKHFVVVNWDQRGAGKSFSTDHQDETMDIELFLSDTKELIDLITKQFSKEKIFLIGHSWGSILGLITAYRYPELLNAYIGMGQVIDGEEGEACSYSFTLEQAKMKRDDLDVSILKSIGAPPYINDIEALLQQRFLLGKYGGSLTNMSYLDMIQIRSSSPYYTESDNAISMQAFQYSLSALWDEVMKINFFNSIKEVRIPIYFFTGRNDYQTPSKLVEQYFEILKAPYKEIVWFEKSAHMPNLEEPEVYQDKLISIVRKSNRQY